MSTVEVRGDMDGTQRGLNFMVKQTPRRMAKVVKDAAQRGNRNARSFASEQHTMFSDVDADYPFSMTVERIGQLAYEYGPDAALPEGSKATGYEYGSVNQAYPHLDVTRSFDIETVEFPLDVADEQRIMWQEAGW